MKMVIFPGGGSPDNPTYASVYRLLERAARERNYTLVDASLRWPGHNHQGMLTLDGALMIAEGRIDVLDAESENYDILARSFGCIVALRLALKKQPKRLRRIILWGPPPYWWIWEKFCRDIGDTKKELAEKGLSVDESFFPTCVPLEFMLPAILYETVVVTGDQDPNVPQAYLEYLKSIVMERKSRKHCQSIRFKEVVLGAVHEVTEDTPAPVIEAYLKALFE